MKMDLRYVSFLAPMLVSAGLGLGSGFVSAAPLPGSYTMSTFASSGQSNAHSGLLEPSSIAVGGLQHAGMMSMQGITYMSASSTPLVQVQGHASNSADSSMIGPGFVVSAQASLTYWIEIAQTGTLPIGVSLSYVPLWIFAMGEASASGYNATAQAQVTSSLAGLSRVANCAAAGCEQSFDGVTGVNAPLGSAPISITISVSGTAAVDALTGHTVSEFQAVADPYIGFDPSFEYKDYFQILISENIQNTPPGQASSVPEPQLYLLLALGLMLIGATRRHGRTAPRAG